MVQIVVENHPFPGSKDLSGHGTGCFGITIFPDDPADGDGLVIHSDQAMYAVKRQGKDGWGLYNSQFSLS